MQWKTNWSGGESYNYLDAQRLLDNYAALRDLLNSEYGFALDFTPPRPEDYSAIHTAEALNYIEGIVAALHVWQVPWLPPPPPWEAEKHGPRAADINRWERNAQEIEITTPRIAAAWRYSGTFSSGQGGLL